MLLGVGEGGVSDLVLDKRCAAPASKPIPNFKGHFGGKGYSFLGIFLKMWVHFSKFLETLEKQTHV